MTSVKVISAIAMTSMVLGACASLSDRTFPDPPWGYKVDDQDKPILDSQHQLQPQNIEELLFAVSGLRKNYRDLIVVYNSDIEAFSFYYLAAATASAAAAVFGGHPDAIKGAALAAGVGVGGETILSPERKRDALESAEEKLGCVVRSARPLLHDDIKPPNATTQGAASRTTILSAVHDIHGNLLKEFKGGRVDYSTQAKTLVEATKESVNLNNQIAGLSGKSLADKQKEAELQEARRAVLQCVI